VAVVEIEIHLMLGQVVVQAVAVGVKIVIHLLMQVVQEFQDKEMLAVLGEVVVLTRLVAVAVVLVLLVVTALVTQLVELVVLEQLVVIQARL
jgi:hypothetical protein